MPMRPCLCGPKASVYSTQGSHLDDDESLLVLVILIASWSHHSASVVLVCIIQDVARSGFQYSMHLNNGKVKRLP